MFVVCAHTSGQNIDIKIMCNYYLNIRMTKSNVVFMLLNTRQATQNVNFTAIPKIKINRVCSRTSSYLIGIRLAMLDNLKNIKQNIAKYFGHSTYVVQYKK